MRNLPERLSSASDLLEPSSFTMALVVVSKSVNGNFPGWLARSSILSMKSSAIAHEESSGQANWASSAKFISKLC